MENFFWWSKALWCACSMAGFILLSSAEHYSSLIKQLLKEHFIFNYSVTQYANFHTPFNGTVKDSLQLLCFVQTSSPQKVGNNTTRHYTSLPSSVFNKSSITIGGTGRPWRFSRDLNSCWRASLPSSKILSFINQNQNCIFITGDNTCYYWWQYFLLLVQYFSLLIIPVV